MSSIDFKNLLADLCFQIRGETYAGDRSRQLFAEVVAHEEQLRERAEAAEKRVADLEDQLMRTKRAWKIHADHVDACPMLDDDAIPIVPRLRERIAELEAQLSEASPAAYFKLKSDYGQLRAQLAGERRTIYEPQWRDGGGEWRPMLSCHEPTIERARRHIDSGCEMRIVEVTEIRRTLDTTGAKEK